MPMPLNPELRDSLLQIYEYLRFQQEAVQEMYAKIHALETALLTNPSFEQLLADATKDEANDPIQTRAFASSLARIDEMIQALREPPVRKPN